MSGDARAGIAGALGENAVLRTSPKLGDLQARAPIAGTIFNLGERWHCPARSYNPRRFADSRRKWARDREALFSKVPQVGFLTTTLPAAQHGEITSELLEYESRAWRGFKQRVDRLLRSMLSGDRCDCCILRSRSCVRRVRGRLVGAHHCRCADRKHHLARRARGVWDAGAPTEALNAPAPRIRIVGRCAQCSHWRRLDWWKSRHVWACSGCLARPRLSLRSRDAKPCFRASWVREVGESGQHLHRHAKVTLPYVPQSVLSEMAENAGLGKVLDIRLDRDSAAPESRGALDNYLVKQSKAAAAPEHRALAGYFAKQAKDPDAFNALPVGAARSRINFPVDRESAHPGTVFTRLDDATVHKLFFTHSEREIDSEFYVLPDRYLPHRRATTERPAARAGPAPPVDRPRPLQLRLGT